MSMRATHSTAWSVAATLRPETKNLLRRLESWQFQRRWLQRDDRRYVSLNATSWRRRRRSTTSLRPSQSSLHAPFLKRGLFACSALNARSNDCHDGLLCMTQRAQYRTQMWVRTLCVVVRSDFLCYALHFQHKKLNSPWRCSRRSQWEQILSG